MFFLKRENGLDSAENRMSLLLHVKRMVEPLKTHCGTGEMSRFNLRRADEKLTLAKRWDKARDYEFWVEQERD